MYMLPGAYVLSYNTTLPHVPSSIIEEEQFFLILVLFLLKALGLGRLEFESVYYTVYYTVYTSFPCSRVGGKGGGGRGKFIQGLTP